MATVLNEKGGVITEPRFQNMSTAQWMFHYVECMKFKNKEKKEFADLAKAILSALETFSLYSHPKMDISKVIEGIEKRKLNETAPEMEKDATEAYEYAMSMLPKSLTVIEEKQEEKTFLPQAEIPKRKTRKKKSEL